MREIERAWRRAHPEVLRPLAAQWVVLEGEQVIAVGPDPVPLVQTARAQGIRSPYVFRVDVDRP